MIVIGNVTLSEKREAALSTGAIIAALDGDHFRRLWLGNGRGRDLLFAEFVDRDGIRYMMGRIRIHVDDRVEGSRDRKEVTHVVAARDIPDDVWELAVAAPLLTAEVAGGIETIHEVKVEGGLGDLQRALATVGPEVGFNLAFREERVPLDEEGDDGEA